VRASTASLIAALVVATAACGTEPVAEELFATRVERPAADDPGDADVPRLPPSVPLDALVPPAPREVVEVPDVAPAPDPDADDGSAVDADASAAPAPAPPPRPAAGPTVPSGPTDGDLARFVKQLADGALEADHRVEDVTGDGTKEVVVARRVAGDQAHLLVGRWQDGEVRTVGTTSPVAATKLGRLVWRELAGGARALLLPHVDHPHRAVLVAAVAADASLTTPDACPLPDGPAEVRLDFGQGARTVALACDRSQTRGPDALVWAGDGRFVGTPSAAGRG
jgi:hypothetical protein